ncbi:MAG TPA: ATP-binding protein [Sporichthyaceae bacterium]|nr:ATP-binding protein [Sporichthyaceae bacterium]
MTPPDPGTPRGTAAPESDVPPEHPAEGRVRTPPDWLRRPVAVPRVNVVEPLPAAEQLPDPDIWESLVRNAAPADLREIAALTPSPAPAPDHIPIKVRQPTAVFHLLATRFNNLTLKVRVGALVALVVGITVAVTSLAAFFTIRAQLYNSFDRSLIGRAQALELTPATDFTDLVHFPSGIFAAADTRLAIVYPDGTPFYSSPEDSPPIGDQELKVANGTYRSSIRTTDYKGHTYRVYAIPKTQEEGSRTAFVLAQTTGEIDRTLQELGTALLVIGLAGVALATYAGVVVARQGLRPVTQLTQAAEHVARTGELRPIKVRGDDELARLGASFNSMLLAVERSRDRQRRLVADAGHELRTPLTSLRTNLDLLAQAQNQAGLSAVDKAELLGDVRAQVEELTGLVSDLVELARDDVERSEGRPVDMAEVVALAVERARRRAPEVTFDVRTRPWTVFGDSRALERAVLNLLDNAGKWSPAGGTVTVRLSDGVVSVADEGPGIAEADLPFVFERFYRSEESRTMPGSGLGLAIVRQAAERHGGTVTADRAAQGGALMRMRLPHSSSVTHTTH